MLLARELLAGELGAQKLGACRRGREASDDVQLAGAKRRHAVGQQSSKAVAGCGEAGVVVAHEMELDGCGSTAKSLCSCDEGRHRCFCSCAAHPCSRAHLSGA